MAAVSSSGRAVYEDEMGLAEGSDTSTPIFVPDSKCRWGQGRSLSLSKGRPKPLIPGSPFPHSGLDPESPEPPVAPPPPLAHEPCSSNCPP